MSARPRSVLSRGLVVVLLAAPAIKLIQSFLPSGPSDVSREASRLGHELFVHEWKPGDALAKGDGLGPVYNASSCVECHNQGGAGGGGPIQNNVTVYGLNSLHPQGIPQSGVVHQKAVSAAFQETLSQLHPSLPRQPSLPLSMLTGRSRLRSPEVVITQRNTPALFGDGLIDAIPDEAIIAKARGNSTPARLVGLGAGPDAKVRGRVGRLSDGRVGRFGSKLDFATLGDFVKAACANELGLSNPGRPQPAPLPKPSYQSKGVDLTDLQCGLLTDYIRSLPAPSELVPADPEIASQARFGRSLFRSLGCAQCHSESLGAVTGLYSDLLLHDMGTELESTPGSYGSDGSASPGDTPGGSQPPSPGEWRTPPLWGVADSGPYLHDGRAPTLEQAIESHGGESAEVTARFRALEPHQKQQLIAFLKILRAPSPSAASQNLAAR
jgi:CxxC motif-containing protein (DUF1111 family)